MKKYKRPNRALPPQADEKMPKKNLAKSVSSKIRKVTQGQRVPRKTKISNA